MAREDFIKVVNDVLKDYPLFTYFVSNSSKSSSTYLFIHDDLKFTRSLRVSDHKNQYYGKCNKDILTDKVDVNILRRTLKNLCESLKRKRLYHLLNNIAV